MLAVVAVVQDVDVRARLRQQHRQPRRRISLVVPHDAHDGRHAVHVQHVQRAARVDQALQDGGGGVQRAMPHARPRVPVGDVDVRAVGKQVLHDVLVLVNDGPVQR